MSRSGAGMCHPMKTNKETILIQTGQPTTGGAIFQSPLNQTNNEAADVAAEDPPQLLTLLLEHSIFQHWNSAQCSHKSSRAPDDTNQVQVLFLGQCSHAILCFRGLQQVAKHSTEHRRYNDLFAVAFWKTPQELFGHCSGSRTMTGLVLKVSKGTGCVDVPVVSVFYGVQPWKELLGV